jgi:hypothetical protein
MIGCCVSTGVDLPDVTRHLPWYLEWAWLWFPLLLLGCCYLFATKDSPHG